MMIVVNAHRKLCLFVDWCGTDHLGVVLNVTKNEEKTIDFRKQTKETEFTESIQMKYLGVMRCR